VEAFCAEHTQSYEEVLYEWPSSKFEAFYAAYTRRKVADELSEKRALEIAAVWGNPNLDTEKDPRLRQKIQEQIDSAYSTAIAGLYDELPEQNADQIDTDDPFWAAAQKGKQKRQLPS
jgi:hypothetical protein